MPVMGISRGDKDQWPGWPGFSGFVRMITDPDKPVGLLKITPDVLWPSDRWFDDYQEWRRVTGQPDYGPARSTAIISFDGLPGNGRYRNCHVQLLDLSEPLYGLLTDHNGKMLQPLDTWLMGCYVVMDGELRKSMRRVEQVSQPGKFQPRYKLEAVGVDADGKIKPISDIQKRSIPSVDDVRRWAVAAIPGQYNVQRPENVRSESGQNEDDVGPDVVVER